MALNQIKLISVFSCFFFLNCFGQSIANLDAANGFKIYKLGMACSAMPNIQKSTIGYDGWYESIDRSLFTFLGTNLIGVDLICKEGVLADILLQFQPITDLDAFVTLSKKIIAVFGGYNNSGTEPNGDKFYQWTSGKNVVLSLNLYCNSERGNLKVCSPQIGIWRKIDSKANDY
jgi:hypothetical protein